MHKTTYKEFFEAHRLDGNYSRTYVTTAEQMAIDSGYEEVDPEKASMELENNVHRKPDGTYARHTYDPHGVFLDRSKKFKGDDTFSYLRVLERDSEY